MYKLNCSPPYKQNYYGGLFLIYQEFLKTVAVLAFAAPWIFYTPPVCVRTLENTLVYTDTRPLLLCNHYWRNFRNYFMKQFYFHSCICQHCTWKTILVQFKDVKSVTGCFLNQRWNVKYETCRECGVSSVSNDAKLAPITVLFQHKNCLGIQHLYSITLSHLNLSSILGERVKLLPSVVRADGASWNFFIKK